MLDQSLPDNGALADHDVQHALGDPGLEGELAEAHRRERCQLRGLDHDRVAAGEGRADLPRRDVEREVPRRDQADDAERFAERHVDAAADGDRLAVVLVDGAGVEVQHLRDHPDLAPRAGDRFADVARLDARELLVVLFDERRKPPQQPGAVDRRNGPPRWESRVGAGNRLVGLRGARGLDLGDRLLRRRVQDRGDVFSSLYVRASATRASKSFVSSPASVCQSTTTANRFSGSSTASTVPSSAHAVSRRPEPTLPSPWWWCDFTAGTSLPSTEPSREASSTLTP